MQRKNSLPEAAMLPIATKEYIRKYSYSSMDKNKNAKQGSHHSSTNSYTPVRYSEWIDEEKLMTIKEEKTIKEASFYSKLEQ